MNVMLQTVTSVDSEHWKFNRYGQINMSVCLNLGQWRHLCVTGSSRDEMYAAFTRHVLAVARCVPDPVPCVHAAGETETLLQISVRFPCVSSLVLAKAR